MLLYHYTTMDTFYSMIEHSLYPKGDDVVPTHLIMWAGHYSYQNDPTECELYFKGLKKKLDTLSSYYNPSKKRGGLIESLYRADYRYRHQELPTKGH